MKSNTLYHTDELFRLIDAKLKTEGLLPDILDYGMATSKPQPIKTICWDTIGRVNFGGSEGIYLDLWLEGDVGNGKAEQVGLGTYKTLLDDKDAFKAMSVLNAEFVFAVRAFVEEHMDDFNWIGYDVHFYRDGKKIVGYSAAKDMNAAQNLVHRLFHRENYDYAILINNENGEEKTIKNNEGGL